MSTYLVSVERISPKPKNFVPILWVERYEAQSKQEARDKCMGAHIHVFQKGEDEIKIRSILEEAA